MFGNSGKHGRVGGGGGRGAKRMIPPPPPPHRPSGSAGRLSIGAGPTSGQRNGGPALSASSSVPDETFSLVSHEPLAFGLIIRLAPDLLEEIRRVESQGGAPKIKFDANPNNPAGNVIDVGGKDFRFTWSREFGDCDVYEERQSGEDGSGLLVESGSVWRKLNLQRVLDESTKNHVKMRSEEAERQLKSRKAIVLDPANPSFKNQVKTLAAAGVDLNPRRMPFKQKKEPSFKKRKVDIGQVPIAGPPKHVFKPGISSTNASKGQPSVTVSPQPSPPEHSVLLASPFGSRNLPRGKSSVDEVIVTQQGTSKVDPINSEKEIGNKAVGTSVPETSGHKDRLTTPPMDLRGTLVNLLLENHKGMTLSALEKVVGDTNPNSRRKIETIIKNIATFQAPGRYFLKPGVEMESFKKPPCESGSSPDSVHNQTPVAESNFSDKAAAEACEPQSHLNARLAENISEKVDTQQISLEISGRKDGNNCEEKGGSSSESGSDSESESDSSGSGSDTGSQSRSRSKSRSPARTGSGTSSDSESDTSSSKEGSDVDVDIMASDDEKEVEQKLKVNERVESGTSDEGNIQNGVDENKEDGLVSSSDLFPKGIEKSDDMDDAAEIDVDITTDSPIADNVKVENRSGLSLNIDLIPQETKSRTLGGEITSSADNYKQLENDKRSYAGMYNNGMSDKTHQREIIGKTSSGHERSNNEERMPINKSKRASDSKQLLDKSESARSSKAEGLGQEPTYNVNAIEKYGNVLIESQKGYGEAVPSRPLSYENTHSAHWDSHHSSKKTGDANTKGKAIGISDTSGKYVQNMGQAKVFESAALFPDKLDGSAIKNAHLQDKISIPKGKLYKEFHYEDNEFSERSFSKPTGGIAVGEKLGERSYRKSGEESGKLKDSALVDRGKILRRELSDLELGEFREPMLNEEMQGVKKQFERKNSFKSSDNEIRQSLPIAETQGVKRQFDRSNSFKSSENKLNYSENMSLDSNKGRPVGKAHKDPKKLSPLDAKIGANQELFKKRRSDEDPEDFTRRQVTRVDHVDSDAVFQSEKVSDTVIKARKNEGRAGQGIGLESHAGLSRKTPSSMLETNFGGQTLISNTYKDTNLLKGNAVLDLSDKRKNSCLMESCNGGKRESSSDEDTSLYTKYAKEEPELKGPIKDHLQYKEYVQEYREMFGHYSFLAMNLEKYRSEFEKLGRDLELAKDRDMERYHNILEQLKQSYRRKGMRHKRLKKVFLVIHEELKHIKQRIFDYAQTYPKQNSM